MVQSREKQTLVSVIKQAYLRVISTLPCIGLGYNLNVPIDWGEKKKRKTQENKPPLKSSSKSKNKNKKT